MNKSIDCLELKNKLQKQLFNEINVSSAKEYINKLKNSINKSEWINRFIAHSKDK